MHENKLSYICIYSGVGFVMRKMGAVAKPNVTISLDGEQWSIKSETSFTKERNLKKQHQMVERLRFSNYVSILF